MLSEEIRPGIRLTGLGPGPVTVVAVVPIGEVLEITFRRDGGALASEVLYPDDLSRLDQEGQTARWTFDADGTEFRLAAEALRMRNAGLADPMMAVQTSAIDPLPHQIRAVYGTMLEAHGPLRFLLADDPGAGKTIMAGLYLKELILRGDVQRCLIVSPGGLVEQWQTELAEKFGLELTILTRDLVEADREGNPFRAHPMLIARMDQLARDDDLRATLQGTEWDLVVVDEAHRMSAHWFSHELRRTRRYELGEVLGRVTRHLLLMTATPHSGDEADYQAFLALLDPDRFSGEYRPGVHVADTTGLMRRTVKEDLLTFDGKPLFPERIAETVGYTLTPLELELYEEVTNYVRTEMNRAERLDDHSGRRGTVGFALTVLQRRLASSPEAIYQSLRRRIARLKAHRDEILAGTLASATVDPDAFDEDEYDAEEIEQIEEQVLDAATAARTAAELDAELLTLAHLEQLAAQVRASGDDRKWTELRTLVLEARDAGLRSPAQVPNKLIVFTEHRDTLSYLQRRISTLLGDDEAVVTIHGGTHRQERRRIRETFTTDARCHVLVATDAAGEGLNLQAAHLMVNYDLPWNPNRIEQRFGRIHRIGQREVCRLWNLVAEQTREGQVFARLLLKIDEQRKAYGGKVFDVLGQNAFHDTPLRELLIEAIRYGDQPEVRERIDHVVDASVSDGLAEILQERALATPEITLNDLADLRREMDEARARRLQPHFVQAFVVQALRALGGRASARERGRFEITHVPAVLRQGPRPIPPRYSRVTFDLDAIDLDDAPPAELIAPGHPLMEALVEAILAKYGDALTRGATLVDDEATVPRLVLALFEELTDGTGAPVSRRFDYVSVLPTGSAQPAGPAAYLDLRTLADDETTAADVVTRTLDEPWLADGVDEIARTWAVGHGLLELRAKVVKTTAVVVDRTRRLVRQRLRAQQHYWDAEAVKLAADQAAGKRIRISPATATERARTMEARLAQRLQQLDLEAQIGVRPPRVVSAALVLPATSIAPTETSQDDETTTVERRLQQVLNTAVTERRAVDAVLAAEKALSRTPHEMDHNNKGYDIRSDAPDGTTIFIEVKGRILGAEDFTITFSEVALSKNAVPHYRLALVTVDTDTPDGSNDQVRYLLDPFHDLVLDEYTNDLRRPWKKEWARGVPPT